MLHRSSFFFHTVSLSLDAETVTTWRWLEWTSVLQCRLSDNISPLTMNEFAPLHCLDMPSVSRVEDVVMDDNVCAARLLYARKSGSPIVFRHEARVNFHNLENASLLLRIHRSFQEHWKAVEEYDKDMADLASWHQLKALEHQSQKHQHQEDEEDEFWTDCSVLLCVAFGACCLLNLQRAQFQSEAQV